MENFIIIFLIIALCLFSAFTNTLVNVILKWVFSSGKSSEEKLLISDLKAMNKELSKISPLDEFAKYAKLQRKIDRNKATVTEIAKSRIITQEKYKDILIKTFNAISGILIIATVWTYTGETIVVIPERWMYPITGLLINEGNISATTFFIVTRYTVKHIFTQIINR